MTPDIINAAFESIGAVLSWVNVKALCQHKKVQGVYWPITAFWSLWGFWNLAYYPSLDQWYSTIAALFLALGNTAWVVLAVWYRRKNG